MTSTCIYFLFSGFCGTHLPPVLPSDALGDNEPDVCDEADFDIPNTQAELEKFMSNMSKLADDEYRSLSVLLDSLPDPSSFFMDFFYRWTMINNVYICNIQYINNAYTIHIQ
jgi:hypothetical protein